MGSAIPGLADSIFGGGSDTSQSSTPDAYSQQLNRIRAQQAGELFGTSGLAGFASPGGNVYQPSPDVAALLNRSMQAYNTTPGLSFSDYTNLGLDKGTFERALQHGGMQYEGASNANRNLYESALGYNREAIGGAGQQNADVLGALRSAGLGDYSQAYNANAQNYAGLYGSNAGNFGQLYGNNAANFNQLYGNNANIFGQLYGSAIDSSRNYINQIATPAIMQQMAMSGLDASGASAAAIGKASAEASLPLMQALFPQYMGEQASLGQSYLGQQGQLGGQYLGSQAALGQGYQGAQASLGQGYQGAQSALGQGYQAAAAGLGQQNAAQLADINKYFGGIDVNTRLQQAQSDRGLFQSYLPLEKQFISSLPQTAMQYGSYPYQNAALAAQAGSSMFPLADYSRQLQEQDLMRRQGLATTAFTGLPYTPGTTTEQDVNKKPLFNFFGFG
jgi:hypothetical protein